LPTGRAFTTAKRKNPCYRDYVPILSVLMNQDTQSASSYGNAGTLPPGKIGRSLTLLVGLFFGLFLFASSFSIALAQVSLGFCVILFLGIMFLDRPFPISRELKPLFLAWGAYLAWLVLSSLVNPHPLKSLDNIREEWLLVILPIGVYLHSKKERSDRLIMVLATTLFLISIYGVIQHFTGLRFSATQHIHAAGDSYRLSGNFSHPLTYGYYVVTATVFYLAYLVSSFRQHSFWNRLVLTGAVTAGLAASILCNSRGPMLALVIGLLTIGGLLGRWRWTLAGLAALTVLVLLLSPGLLTVFSQRVLNDWQSDNPAGRLFIWRNSVNIACDNPLLGCGPGNFGEAYRAHLPPDFKDHGAVGHAHDDFIHLAAVGGFPAMALFVVFLGVACRHFWRLSRAPGTSERTRALTLAALAASIAFVAASLTEAAFADEELRQVLLALWATSWAPYRSTD